MIVLDTHAWLWWLHDPERLSPGARQAIETATAADLAIVSAISVWEVAWKHKLGKLQLPLPMEAWYARARRYPGIHFVEIDEQIALLSTALPDLEHRDPADRFILATARHLGASVVTRDARLLGWPHAETIW